MRSAPRPDAPPAESPGRERPQPLADPAGLRLPEALSGLHPAASHPCPRCGTRTQALANGRGRMDICDKCGTFEMLTHEGIEVFTLRGVQLPSMQRKR